MQWIETVSDQALQTDQKYCAELVKQDAHDLHLANLLLPDQHRLAISVLHAFHVEISNIAMGWGEPLPRQMKLQWWREVLSGQRKEEALGNPLARALMALISTHDLPIRALTAKLDAHLFDLYNDPMGDKTMLEGHLGETRSILFQLAGTISGIQSDSTFSNASGHAGVAVGIVTLLQDLHRSHSRQQIYIPSNLMEASGLSYADYLATPDDAHLSVVRGMIDLAAQHRRQAMSHISMMEGEARSLFSSLALVPSYLAAIGKHNNAIFQQPVSLSQLKKQWVLWRF